MLPFLNGMLLFLLRLNNILITYHPQHFSASKLLNIPSTNFQKPPTLQTLIQAFYFDISLLRPSDKSFYYSKNTSETTFHQIPPNKTSNSYHTNSRSQICSKPPMFNQLTYKTMKTLSSCPWTTPLYQNPLRTTNSKKYAKTLFALTKYHPSHAPLRKHKNLQKPSSTTLHSYLDLSSPFSNATSSFRKELNKSLMLNIVTLHIYLSSLILDPILQLLANFSAAHPSTFSLNLGTSTPPTLNTNSFLSHSSIISYPSGIAPKKHNNLGNILLAILNTLMDFTISTSLTKTTTIKKITNKTAHFLSLNSPCLLYTSPSPRDLSTSRMPSSA